MLYRAPALLLCALRALAVHPVELLPAHARGGELYSRLSADAAAAASSLTARLGPFGNSTPNSRLVELDNFSPGAGTFPQRFFFDTTFCGARCGTDAPVVAEFTGEWTAGGSPGGSAAQLAAEMGALLVTAEHRFYGCSRPGGGCRPSTDPSLMVKYLSVEQAVADGGTFIPFFEDFAAGGFRAPADAPPRPLPPSFRAARKWVAVGGSYAGAYVSWLSVAHGELLAATWASSGVVNAIFNFSGFDQVVGDAVGDDCSNALRAVYDAFEAAWGDDADRARLLGLFYSPPGLYTAGDFAWMLADSAGMAPQYGSKDALCKALNSTARPTPGAPAPPDPGWFFRGWSALEAFAAWTNGHYGKGFGSSCYYSTKCLADAGDAATKSDTTTWVFQCCSQVAFWNIAREPGVATRSQWVNSTYFEAQCGAVYGPSVFPDTDAFNAKWGGAKPPAKGPVFATQGSDDPWQLAGVDAPLGDKYREVTAVCEGCSHCRDLSGAQENDPQPLAEQRAAVVAAIKGWVAVA